VDKNVQSWKEDARIYAQNADFWRDVAEKLWHLLEEISAMDDACKSDDAAFRREAYRLAERRLLHLPSSDDYELVAQQAAAREDADGSA
jgi:hypothetical protein